MGDAFASPSIFFVIASYCGKEWSYLWKYYYNNINMEKDSSLVL